MSEHIAVRDGGTTTEQGAFRFLAKLFRPGYISGWGVSQRAAGANMSVDVAAGDGSILRSSDTYGYYGFSTAVKNITITAADGSNPRRDIIVAYLDKSVVNPATDDNEGALKFVAVAGTPAGSPSDPSDGTIQSAIGAANPFIKLARVAVGTGVTSIVDANITDLRTIAALQMPRLYGGGSNTQGHLVPNVADDTVALLAAVQTLTNKTLTAPNISTPTLKGVFDGWINPNESWEYLSATTITIPSGGASRYRKGQPIRLKQGGGYKYFYIIGVADTVLTITGGSSYTLTNDPITDNYYSMIDNPLDFPSGFEWTPVFTGFSTDPTVANARFRLRGTICWWTFNYNALGNSNNTFFTFTLPIASKTGGHTMGGLFTVNNGAAAPETGLAVCRAASAVCDVYSNNTQGSWTSSSTKGFNGNGEYEIN